MSVHTDVLIVGAGPSGLLLAGDLAQAGVAVTVLERRGQESNLTRAFAVHARTLELLDARGVADELITTGARVGVLRLLGRITIDLTSLPSRYPYLLVTPQYQTERVLEERARKLGAEILTGAEVIGLRQDPDGVEVEVRSGDGTVSTRRSGYLVGADGVHSIVRRTLGLPFPGRSAVQSVMLADVMLAQAPQETLSVNAIGDAFGFIAPFGDGWYRVIAWDRHRQLPDTAPVELEEIRTVIHRTLGTDYGMHQARWLSRFHSDERQVPSYRRGRVFLVGDAAHVHSPAGGQGMNTGLQDAANLGWKLAAAIHGWVSPSLLDSYQAERYPVGRTVLRMSGTLLRLGIIRPWLLPLARALITPLSRLRPITRRAAAMVSGIAIGYPTPPGGHPLAGRRASDTALTGAPHRLYAALRSGQFVLVAPPELTQVVSDGWGSRIRPVNPTSPTEPVMLIRPDGYVAWAADDTDPATTRQALTEWCGTPTAPH
jgi:2-polyprenyl-6-methoxyphenol hydroxylase-like FAD-dependent oxidoreductase